ncbi:MAG: heavy-metal-associated domain-containing protein, partial [Steroidobacteraceae bacterium]
PFTEGIMKELTLRIENMHCGACVRRVSQALENVGGVKIDEVRIGGARVHLQDDLPDSTVVAAIARAGYPAIIEH